MHVITKVICEWNRYLQQYQNIYVHSYDCEECNKGAPV